MAINNPEEQAGDASTSNSVSDPGPAKPESLASARKALGSSSADVSAAGSDQPATEQDKTLRDVLFEPLVHFAARHRIPVNRVRELNPDAVDSDGNITKGKLKVE